jgi:hypothetical protein
MRFYYITIEANLLTLPTGQKHDYSIQEDDCPASHFKHTLEKNNLSDSENQGYNLSYLNEVAVIKLEFPFAFDFSPIQPCAVGAILVFNIVLAVLKTYDQVPPGDIFHAIF